MPITNGELHREIGELEVRLSALEEATARNTDKLDELVTWKNQLEGGKRAIVIAITAAATVGGILSWAMTHLAWK